MSLPIKPSPQLKAERHCSNDSGIEVEMQDPGYRTNNSEPLIMVLSDNKPADNASDLKKEVSEPGTKARSDDFLDDKISYTLPYHTLVVQNNVISITLEVKNVSADSFMKKLSDDRMAAGFKFSSIGSGHVPIHHAFAVEFLSDQDGQEALDEDKLEVEFWDNNVVIQFPCSSLMSQRYKVGLSLLDLKNTVHKLKQLNVDQKSDVLSNQVSKSKKKNKYQTEKHPKAMKQSESDEITKKKSEDQSDVDKIRYCSGDSVDSSMSESPMEIINLEYPEDEYEDDEDMKTEDSCDEDLQLVSDAQRYKRAISEESQLVKEPKRGILKKRMSVHGSGGRFRCYSESNMDDIGLTGSSDKLSFALSEATISENDADYSFSCSHKKSVSFNEKVQQQYYR